MKYWTLERFIFNPKDKPMLARNSPGTPMEGQDKNLLLVSRQLSQEALDVLYGDNVFF